MGLDWKNALWNTVQAANPVMACPDWLQNSAAGKYAPGCIALDKIEGSINLEQVDEADVFEETPEEIVNELTGEPISTGESLEDYSLNLDYLDQWDTDVIGKQYSQALQEGGDPKAFWQDVLTGLDEGLTDEEFETKWTDFEEGFQDIAGHDPAAISRLGREKGMHLDQLSQGFGGDTGLNRQVGQTGLGMGSGISGIGADYEGWDQFHQEAQALNQAHMQDITSYWDKLGGNVFDFATAVLDPDPQGF